MPTFVFAILMFAAGFVFAGLLFASSEGALDTFAAVAGAVIRPVMPIMWSVRAWQDRAEWQSTDLDGRAVFVRSIDNTWVVLFDRADSRVGFSPLLLVPVGAVLLAVRLLGRPVRVLDGGGEEATGYIFRALRLAPGLRLARRRDEDLAYMREHGQFPAVALLAD